MSDQYLTNFIEEQDNPKEIFDALSIIVWYGFNTRARLIKNDNAREYAKNLISEIICDEQTPDKVRKVIIDCFESAK